MQSWHKRVLDALNAKDVQFLTYLPDGVLAPLIDLARSRSEFDLVQVTREEEGVAVAAGMHLAGRRSALLMQVSGLGNSLNVLGSLVLAQRIPLLMFVTERGGLWETVSTQVPFGSAATRVLDAIGIGHFDLSHEEDVDATVSGAVDLAFVSRVPVALMITTSLLVEHV